MSKLQAICPHCDASFKLKDQKAVGKMVNCPSCGEAFRIELGAEEFDDVDFDDEPDPFEDDDYSPVRSERAPAARRSSRPQPARKPKSNVGGQIVVFGIAGLMGIGFLVAAGFGVSWMMKGGDSLDTAYLDADTEVVVHMKVSELAKSELLKDEFANAGGGNPFAGGGFGGGGFGRPERDEVEPEDIRSVTIGFTGLSQLADLDVAPGPFGALEALNQVKFLVVVNSKKRLIDDGAEQGLEPKKHKGETYYHLFSPQMSLWQASSRTVLVGDTNSIKGAIERGTGSKSLSKFNFVDGGQDFVVAVKPNNIQELRDNQPEGFDIEDLEGAPDSLKKVVKALDEGAIGFAFGANVDSDVKVLMQIETDGVPRATTVETDLNALIAWGRSTVDQYRSEQPEMAKAVDLLLEDLVVSRKDETIAVSMSMSGEKQQEIERLMARAQGMAMRQVFNQPQFNPGFNPGGGVNPGGGGVGRVERQPREPKDTRPNVGIVEDLVTNKRTFVARNEDKQNLTTIGEAIEKYHDTNGNLPTGIRDGSGRKLLSWRVQILPYLGEQALYDDFRLNSPWDSPQNKALAARMPAVFRSPMHAKLAEDGNADKTTYAAYQNGTMLGDPDLTKEDVEDGLDKTIMVTDTGQPTEWTKPDSTHVVHSIHRMFSAEREPAKSFNVLFGDGVVRTLSPRTTGDHFKAMLTRAGNEIVDPDDGVVEIGAGPVPVVQRNGDVDVYPSGRSSSNSVAVSPDGKVLVVGKSNSEIRTFLLETGHEADVQTELRDLRNVSALAFSPDGTKLLSGGGSGVVFVWEIDEEGMLKSAGEFRGHKQGVDTITVAKSGQVLSGGRSETVCWDLETKAAIGVFPTGGKALWISPDGKKGYASDGQQIVALSLEASAAGQPVKLQGFGFSTGAAFSPDGSKLYSARANKLLAYDTASGTPLGAIDTGGSLNGLVVSPNGTALAAGANDKAKVWKVNGGGAPPTEYSMNDSRRLAGITFSADGSKLAFVGESAGVVSLGGGGTGTQPPVAGGGGGELKIVPSLLPANLPNDKGRAQPAIMLRLSLVGGEATKAKSYGMVKVEEAVDQDGRPLKAFPLPKEVDYTEKQVTIEAGNRTPIGVHVYVVFSQPNTPVQSISAKGTLVLELTDGTTVDVPFDQADVTPTQ